MFALHCMIRTSDIQIRDPFVVPVPAEGRYYLFGTTGTRFWLTPEEGFNPAEEGLDLHVSCDLENWEGPFRAFQTPPRFWADHHYWSPEVHFWQGRWYMLASFKPGKRCRGTQILAADSLYGPFLPHSVAAVTPPEWECLDGTLFCDDAGDPWMVFCHEWVQVEDGEICAVRLSRDLRHAIGTPIMLFRASEAKWSVANPHSKNYVTDGPWFHRTENGQLLLLWSSVGSNGYAVGIARSQTGRLEGPWIQQKEPLFAANGGHGMLFRTFAGELRLSLHRPNVLLHERPAFLPVREVNGGLLVEC